MKMPNTSPRTVYFDQEFNCRAHKISQGGYCVLKGSKDMIVTSLGSCVAVCLRDPVVGVGGMNHFILPEEGRGTPEVKNNSLCYGTAAMERLIGEIVMQGGAVERLELKAFGGASVMNMEIGIGAANCRFVEDFARRAGLSILASDFAGLYPRRLHYFPATGKAFVQRLERLDEQLPKEKNTVLPQDGLAARAEKIEQCWGNEYGQD